MINRRHLLGGLAAAGAAVTAATGAASLVSSAQAAGPTMSLAPSVPAPVFGPRMNFEQADKIMAELGLDAIVVGGGTNLYHATGLDLTATKMGRPIASVICLILQLTLVGWIPAAIWAVWSLNSFSTDKKIVAAVKNQGGD